jgi:RNA polymerase sigma-70 factor (ECF subfamily)
VILPSTHPSIVFPLREELQNEEAWQAFHARYQEVILTWCRRRELPLAWAEDLTQEIWLKLLREIRTYDPAKGRLRSWLKAVVNNTLTDFWRRHQRNPERGGVGGTAFLEQLAGLASPRAADDLSLAIEQQADSSAAKVLARVRARVHETTWQAFSQTLVEERPAREVARALGISISAVYKNTYRVKQILHEEYRHVHPGDQACELSGSGDPAAAPE